jgi:hypothetical protein
VDSGFEFGFDADLPIDLAVLSVMIIRLAWSCGGDPAISRRCHYVPILILTVSLRDDIDFDSVTT